MRSHLSKQQGKQYPSSEIKAGHQQRHASAFQFMDNRSAAIQMQKLQELADNSQKIQQLKALQERADKSTQTRGRMQPNQLNAGVGQVVQRTEIDAIKYVNGRGLWQGGPRGDNWLVQLLGQLWYSNNFAEYKTLYDILIEGLPEKPVRGTDGYQSPTVYEVNAALDEEIQRLKLQREAEIRRNFGDASHDTFSQNHYRDSRLTAADCCRARLRSTSQTDTNTVLILTPAEKQAILNTLEEARQKNWDFIFIYCEEAIQATYSGIRRIIGVHAKLGLDQNFRLHHFFGEPLTWRGSDNQIG
jgi:hypothetical protein